MFMDELLFSINCYISGCSSLVLTVILIFAIIFKTPKEMRNYRIFLLNISVTDALISLSMIMLQPLPSSSVKEIERPANDSGVSYVIMGPVVYFIHPATNHLLTSIFVGIFLYSIMTLPISFFYRYITVCRPLWVQMFFKKQVLFAVFLVLAIFGLLAAFFMYAGDMPKSGPAAIVASWSEYYSHKGDSNETRFGNLIHMNYMVFYMCYIALFAIIAGYTLLIFSAYNLFHILKTHQSTVSKRTLELQQALAMSLVVQSCVPILFVGIPLLIIIITVSTGTYTPLINSIAMLIFSYQVLLSPLISFYFVRPYRRVLSAKGLKNLLNSKTSSKRVHSEIAIIRIAEEKNVHNPAARGSKSTKIEIL